MNLSDKEKLIIDRIDSMSGRQMMTLLINGLETDGEAVEVGKQITDMVRLITGNPTVAMAGMMIALRATMVGGLMQWDLKKIHRYFDQVKECDVYEPDDGAN
jgi:hypothetical protein